MNNITFPKISDNNVFEIYSGKNVLKFNHADCLNKINEFSKNTKLNYANIVNSAPVIYPVNLTLGLLGVINSKCYSIFPGSYNLHNILKMLELNKSEHLICEDSLMDIYLNKEKLNEVRLVTEKVKQVYVFTNEDSLKEKNLKEFKEIFVNANLNFYSDVNFEKIEI